MGGYPFNLVFAPALSHFVQLGSLIGPLSPKHSISSLTLWGLETIHLSNLLRFLVLGLSLFLLTSPILS